MVTALSTKIEQVPNFSISDSSSYELFSIPEHYELFVQKPLTALQAGNFLTRVEKFELAAHLLFFDSIQPNATTFIANPFFDASVIEAIISKSNEHFGSGWCWLVLNANSEIEIVTTEAAQILNENYFPILCVDLWEHSYLSDWQTNRQGYVSQYLSHINWKKCIQRCQNPHPLLYMV
jgi:superoxide dismutase